MAIAPCRPRRWSTKPTCRAPTHCAPDRWRHHEGAPWFALEYIDGERITSWCDSQRLGTRARVALFLDGCDAVHHAHRNLIVHRDLKPSSILVDRHGVVKLLDFGIAKLLDDKAPRDATTTEQRRLTPAYAAPEQFSGAAITTATDVYALGLLLHELLGGARPEARTHGSLRPLSCGHDAGTPGSARRGQRLRASTCVARRSRCDRADRDPAHADRALRLLAQDEPAAAKAQFEVARAAPGITALVRAIAWRGVADAECALGQRERARAALAEARRLLVSTLPAAHPSISKLDRRALEIQQTLPTPQFQASANSTSVDCRGLDAHR